MTDLVRWECPAPQPEGLRERRAARRAWIEVQADRIRTAGRAIIRADRLAQNAALVRLASDTYIEMHAGIQARQQAHHDDIGLVTGLGAIEAIGLTNIQSILLGHGSSWG